MDIKKWLTAFRQGTRRFGLDETPTGYREMDERKAIKIQVKP